MDYRFGPNKPNFTRTNDEWNKLKQEIDWWNEDTSNYPSITVICPHYSVNISVISETSLLQSIVL